MTSKSTNETVEHELGSRLLYLRTPNFTGSDVEELQTALMALGFACGGVDGVFGAYTEGALRKFQLNMGLDADGISGMDTYDTVKRLNNAWKDKPLLEGQAYMSFARVSDVLERHAVCLFGTNEYTRKIASFISNLALATNPLSKVISADMLLVEPHESMLLAHIVFPGDSAEPNVPRITTADASGSLSRRITAAIDAARAQHESGLPMRIVIEVPEPDSSVSESEHDRLAHHEAISILDSFCMALS